MINSENKFKEISRSEAKKLYAEGGIWISALEAAGITKEDLSDFIIGDRISVNNVESIVISTDSIGNPEWVMKYDSDTYNNLNYKNLFTADYDEDDWLIPTREQAKFFIRNIPFSFSANNLPKHKFIVLRDTIDISTIGFPRPVLTNWYIDVNKGVLSNYYTGERWNNNKLDYLEIRYFKKIATQDILI